MKRSVRELIKLLISSKKKSMEECVQSLLSFYTPLLATFFLGLSPLSSDTKSLIFFFRNLFSRLICLISSLRSSSRSNEEQSEDESSFLDRGVSCGEDVRLRDFLGLYFTVSIWFYMILLLVLILHAEPTIKL